MLIFVHSGSPLIGERVSGILRRVPRESVVDMLRVPTQLTKPCMAIFTDICECVRFVHPGYIFRVTTPGSLGDHEVNMRHINGLVDESICTKIALARNFRAIQGFGQSFRSTIDQRMRRPPLFFCSLGSYTLRMLGQIGNIASLWKMSRRATRKLHTKTEQAQRREFHDTDWANP